MSLLYCVCVSRRNFELMNRHHEHCVCKKNQRLTSLFASVLFHCSWFHGKISGPEAVCKLQPAEDGLFLVRESIRHPGDYVLCVSVSGDVIHYRIIYQDNKLTIDNKQHFYNLIDIVEVGHSAHCWNTVIQYWSAFRLTFRHIILDSACNKFKKMNKLKYCPLWCTAVNSFCSFWKLCFRFPNPNPWYLVK